MRALLALTLLLRGGPGELQVTAPAGYRCATPILAVTRTDSLFYEVDCWKVK